MGPVHAKTELKSRWATRARFHCDVLPSTEPWAVAELVTDVYEREAVLE